MKIVVLDADPATGSARASALTRLDFSPMAALGELVVHQLTRPEETATRIQGADVVLTNKVKLTGAHFADAPSVKLVSVLATGVNVVDLAAAQAAGVTVCNVPNYSTDSTAQHTFALLLELTNQVGLHAADVRDGAWANSTSFSYFKTPLAELSGLTLGVVGFGAIGQKVAQIGAAFGMTILVHTRTARKDTADVRFVTKETLLKESDVVTLHCPLTPETEHFINSEAIAAMKPAALLLNASRGPVIDEAALAQALSDGRLGGAALDVLSQEPPLANNPLLSAPRCLITPHIAWATTEARRRLISVSCDNVRAFVEGAPQNVVS